MGTGDLGSYIIRGGEAGKARMAVIARVLAPATEALLDRCEPLAGRTAIDAGCGGGEIAFLLARRVGPTGRVIGLDLDAAKLALARDEAAARGLGNLDFRQANVLDPWPAGADFALIRFVLTHLPAPEAVLARAFAALEPGGILAAEDIDYRGQFCDPPSPAFDRYGELYVAAAQRRGGDPFIGARLGRLLEAAGFADVEVTLAQPFGRAGDVKKVASLTFAGIADTLAATGIAQPEEIAHIAAELAALADRPDTTMSFPRIFQARGRAPGRAPHRDRQPCTSPAATPATPS
jgi:SAM-dependent methyltransferase